MRRSFFLLAIALILAAITGGSILAQGQYPASSVEFIVPYPPGGPADTAVRIVQQKLSANLRVPIIISNRPGGGGAVGTDFVAKSRPDGSKILATTNGPLTILTAMQSSVTFRVEDFVPVASYMADLGVIAVRADSPWKTLEDLVAYAKQNPGKLSYGSAGVGTVSHFTMEVFKERYGLDIAHVPFQGTAPVKNAVLGGHVQIGASGFASLGPLIKARELVALATTAAKRVPEFPNIPTLAEKGFSDSLNIWMGLFVPAKTPPQVVDTLARALERTMKDPSVVAAVGKTGMAVDYRDRQATQKLLESERQTVSKLVQKLGIRN